MSINETKAQTTAAGESRNVALVRSSYEASARGDIDGTVGILAPDAEWTEMAGFPCAGTYIGPQEVKENVFARLGAEWEGYTCEPDAYYDAGDTVIVTGYYSGTYRATGKSMKVRVTHVWTVRDGQAVRFEQFTDTLLVARAMEPS